MGCDDYIVSNENQKIKYQKYSKDDMCKFKLSHCGRSFMTLFRFSKLITVGIVVILGIFIVGCSDDDNPTKPEGTWSWAPLGTGMNNSIMVFTVYDNKLIAGGVFTTAGGVSANRVADWDGTSWAPLGTGINNRVNDLTVYDNKLIAGGYYTTAGGVSANRVAAWDGTSWAPLGTGMNNDVWTLTVYDNKLIAGGWFTTAGGDSAKYIAEWSLK